jgi:hypothetical protein
MRRSVQRVLRRFVRRAEYGRAMSAASRQRGINGITEAAVGAMARGGQFLTGMVPTSAGAYTRRLFGSTYAQFV